MQPYYVVYSPKGEYVATQAPKPDAARRIFVSAGITGADTLPLEAYHSKEAVLAGVETAVNFL